MQFMTRVIDMRRRIIPLALATVMAFGTGCEYTKPQQPPKLSSKASSGSSIGKAHDYAADFIRKHYGEDLAKAYRGDVANGEIEYSMPVQEGDKNLIFIRRKGDIFGYVITDGQESPRSVHLDGMTGYKIQKSWIPGIKESAKGAWDKTRDAAKGAGKEVEEGLKKGKEKKKSPWSDR